MRIFLSLTFPCLASGNLNRNKEFWKLSIYLAIWIVLVINVIQLHNSECMDKLSLWLHLFLQWWRWSQWGRIYHNVNNWANQERTNCRCVSDRQSDSSQETWCCSKCGKMPVPCINTFLSQNITWTYSHDVLIKTLFQRRVIRRTFADFYAKVTLFPELIFMSYCQIAPNIQLNYNLIG